MPKTIIIAIDPGFDRCGYAIGSLEGNKKTILDFGIISTDRKLPLYLRFQQLSTQLDVLIDQFKPQEAAMENLFLQKNHKTALAVSESRGVIMSCFFRADLTLAQYTPLQIKQAITGFGRADKKAMEKMVRLELSLPLEQKVIDDAIDALACFLTHCASRTVNSY
ncbi:crossover junction endodeoxyribonuclease RuvC [Microgenomates group bacterium]|nr:crossover junction endodeoxyribonuclease RuvC [Microgenomates group bacterium]